MAAFSALSPSSQMCMCSVSPSRENVTSSCRPAGLGVEPVAGFIVGFGMGAAHGGPKPASAN
jgi:hypothetical protein